MIAEEARFTTSGDDLKKAQSELTAENWKEPLGELLIVASAKIACVLLISGYL